MTDGLDVPPHPVPSGRPRRAWRFNDSLAILAAPIVLAIVLAIVVHTPPVRGFVLRYAVAETQRRFGIRVEAARLDYNLISLSVGLAQARVTADRAGAVPLFEADYLRVSLPWRALTGVLAFDEVAITGGRVHVIRDADGRTNLPDSSGATGGAPPALDVGRLTAPRLALDVQDTPGNLRIEAPGIDIDIGQSAGRLQLVQPATVTVGAHATRITSFGGGTTFDGRALTLSTFNLQAAEATAQVQGKLSLLVAEPAVDVRATGTADVERLARWAMDEETPRGSLAFDAHVSGPLGSPVTDLQLASNELTWRDAGVSNVKATSRVTLAGADVANVTFTIAGGQIEGRGLVPFDDSPARINASWNRVDVAVLTTMFAGPVALTPDGEVSGELEASGPFANLAQWSTAARLRLAGGGTRRGRLAAPGVTMLETRDGRWTIDARHEIGGVAPIALVAGGRLEAQDVARSTLDGTLTVSETDARALVGLLGSAGFVSGSDELVSAGTLASDVRLSGRLDSPEIAANIHGDALDGPQWHVGRTDATVSGLPLRSALTFSVEADSATVADQPLESLRASGHLAGNQLGIESVSLAQPGTPGRLQASGTYDLRSERYDAMLEASQWQLMRPADQPFEGRVDVTLKGAGTLDDPGGEGTARITSASWDGTALGDLAADVRVEAGMAMVTANAPDFGATLNSRVGVRAPFQTSADLRVEAIDLARFIPAAPVPVAGRATLAAHVEGAIDTWRDAAVTLDVSSIEASAGDLPIRLAEPAHLRYDGARVYVDRLEVDAGATRVSVSGDLSRSTGPGAIGLAVSGDIGEVVRAVKATGLIAVPVAQASGPVTLQARVTGSIEQPVFTGDLDAGPGTATIEGLSTASDLRLRAHLEDDVVTLQEAHVSYEGATVDAVGSAPLSQFTATPAAGAGPISVRATATNLSPTVLRGIVDPAALEDVSGGVDVSLNLQTPSLDMVQATGDLTLTRLDLRVAGLPVTQRTPTRIVARDGFARIESWTWAGEGTTVAIAGQVRLADRQAALLVNGDIDLRVLTPFVRSAGMTTGGRLTPRLSVTGPLESPRVDGDLALEGGEIRLLDPRVVVNGLGARAILTRTTLTLAQLTGSINGGTLTGEGAIEYRPESTPTEASASGSASASAPALTGRLTADVNDMALEYPVGLRSELSAMLALDITTEEGQATPGGRLSGTVTVLHGEYREPLAVVGGILGALQARRAAAAVAPESPTFLDQLALDVSVQTDGDIDVNNNYARVQIGADLDVVGTAAAPGVSGRVVLREDGQLFVGRNVYTIKPDPASTIDFVNPAAIAPELNAHLTTRAGGEDIDVDLTGAVESPQVAMSSTNGLGQADITALLLTGRTLDALSSADAAFVGTQVIGNLSGEVLGFAGRAIGLDTLRLGGIDQGGIGSDTSVVASEVDPTSRLTFGKSLRSDVNLTFSQSLRDSTAQTWIVQYLPARRVELRYVSGDTGLREYGFRHDVSFGGGAAVATRRSATPDRSEARITEVSVTGELAFPEPRVRGVLKLGQGARFDFRRWQDDRDRLEAFYYANKHLAVRVTASRATNGEEVRLSYVIDAGPETAIVVSGVNLDRAVVQRLSDAWAASVFDEFLGTEATQIVKAVLAEQGYVQAMVNAHVVAEGDRKTLQVDVQPGSRSDEIRVRVEGPDAALSSELEDYVEDQRFVDQVIRDPGLVERGLTAYLRSGGYLRATVSVRSPLVEGGVAIVPIVVDPSPVFVIETVAFRGRQGVSADEVASAAVPARTPYDPAAVDAARARLQALYRRRGFASATVTSSVSVRPETSLVDLVFSLDEGAQQTIGEVVVAGNSGVDADVITSALGLVPGTPLEPEALARARTRVYQTGLFRRVDVTTELIEATSRGPQQPMRVRTTVDAWPALRLRYGIQATEKDSEDSTGTQIEPGLVADLTRRTLLGRPVSLGGTIEYLRHQNSIRALVSAPTLMSLPIQSSMVLERAHLELVARPTVTNTYGISWEQRLQKASSPLSLSYSYRLDRDHTVVSVSDPNFPTFDVKAKVARLIGTVAWDTRNDPLDPVSGSLYSSSVEWAPKSLGSQFRFLKYGGQAYRFQSLHGVVLASAARVGFGRALGGQEFPIGELFYAGGSRTVRGVDESLLGEQLVLPDGRTFALGGEAMLILNQEARVPIYKWLRGVAFIDVGNVFPTPQDFKLSATTGSVGVGVRLATPFALLRADYGRVAWLGATGTATRTSAWYFGIGQAF